MTPFGRRLRELRRERGQTLKAMAAALHVSPAYLSALEHGHRGRPAIPGARFREVPGAAHSVLAEGGAALLDEITEFLQT